ncbi:polyprenol phosphomannose-dependent alpha 1,6 mannosyltransferase MptB [Corynebacterium aquilae]|uniref:Alpha 1,6 mannopyranosyltransferase n=1 Tax=Corynebacterium aquilae DSM 44791 TaxID=1431546 RepID=A0A1L7CG02_9CORY|nr:polyprenol phosphomannose-dependent alpha 1,6 mannosyltransferase MptB [Corynebacterium aquilae]APT84800.1 alpha 1,6 mannopyranosyltransferase [Corynebacterium aquilae DSM 44791]
MKIVDRLLKLARGDAPRLGTAGSRSRSLHVDDPSYPRTTIVVDNSPTATPGGEGAMVRAVVGHDLIPVATAPDTPAPSLQQRLHHPGARLSRPQRAMRYEELTRFAIIRWLGTLGAVLLGFGALGAGALPVVDNPYTHFPGGSIMARMLQTSSVLCYVGVGCIVVAWLLMGPFVGVRFTRPDEPPLLTLSLLRRTAAAWILPLAISAPMFTQDIYSYLAQGSIVAQGIDPYSAGPVDILGIENPLARSVPLIWSHSPSPYGPVALGLAAAISTITHDSIVWGIFLHRFISIVGVATAGWAVYHLAVRCRVDAQAALWMSLLNPLVILHLVGGIHNEALLIGFMLVGIEVGMRGVDNLKMNLVGRAWALLSLSAALITCAGLVKVTGFIALGFTGMWLARELRGRQWHTVTAIGCAASFQIAIMTATIAVASRLTGIGLGWVTGQGGAATIRSWMSITTDVGVISGYLGMLLNLGDHTETILPLTRGAGLALVGLFMLRMLWATYRGAIPPVGGLGVSMFLLVIFFPVVHPWYLIWAIIPLAAFANRPLFRTPAIAYSAIVSLLVLPRGLALPASTTAWIYITAALVFSILMGILWMVLRKRGIISLS